MSNIGITGNKGLLGWHLNAFLLHFSDIHVIGADVETFSDINSLTNFASKCDVIVHFAGMNRGDDKELYETNVGITQDLIDACEKTGKHPHIIFASSTHISKGTPYGNSKLECSRRLAEWAKKTGAVFTNLILPNIFGEGGRPFYNSVASTFCYQIAKGESPSITEDNEIELLHAQSLAAKIFEFISEKKGGEFRLQGETEKVSSLLKEMSQIDSDYKNNLIPDLGKKIHLQLFNTYRSYLYPSYYPVKFNVLTDPRGSLFETIRVKTPGKSYVSRPKPGITRGNHYHFSNFERFIVLQGKAVIAIRKLLSDDVKVFEVSGETPCFVDIPTLHTHSLTNVGNKELLTLFWSGDIYKEGSTDTYTENVYKGDAT